MATTTNYGWTTPDDTALVKDGASAIRTLGSSVDTTTKALNPSTTLGDIEYRSSTANTNTRLGIGTTGQILSVSGGVPAWATVSSGGMTLLSTTTLSGASTTISSIDQTYTNLEVVIFGITFSTASWPKFRPNNGTTLFTGVVLDNTVTTVTNSTRTGIEMSIGAIATYNNTNANNCFRVNISNYASTTANKSIQSTGGFITSTNARAYSHLGYLETTSAITSIVIPSDAGTFSTGTVLIYGVK